MHHLHLIKDEIKHHKGKALGILEVLAAGHALLVLWLFKAREFAILPPYERKV